VARGATTVVLSQGMNKQLHVHPDTCRYLEERSITVHVGETREAVRIYAPPGTSPGRSGPLRGSAADVLT